MGNKAKHFFAPMIWGILSLCLLMVLLRASTVRVGATEDAEPALSQDSETVAQGVSDLHTVMLDGYDGTFTTTFDIQRQITHTGSAEYGWGRVLTSSAGYTDTMWSVGGGQATILDPDTGTYTDGVTTTLTYGPISFLNVVTAELEFNSWISAASGDGVAWGYSTDGNVFTYTAVSPVSTGSWETTTLSSETDSMLASLLGEGAVYIAFRFHSDDDGQVDRGAFLDNVRIQTKSNFKFYLPVLMRPSRLYLPVVLKIPSFLGYSDHFDDPSSGWPTWNKKTYNPDGSESENHRGGYLMTISSAQLLSELISAQPPPGLYRQVRDDGTPVWYRVTARPPISLEMYPAEELDERFYIVARDDGDEIFLTGPEQMPSNFVYQASARWSFSQTRRWGNEYGILISPHPIDPADAHTVHGYSFQVQYNTSTDGGYGASRWVIKRWDRVNWSGGADRLSGYVEDDAHFDPTEGVWNKFAIERYGSRIRLYLNDHLVYTVTDDTYTGKMYVGFFVAHTRDTSYDILYEFDDVRVFPYYGP